MNQELQAAKDAVIEAVRTHLGPFSRKRKIPASAFVDSQGQSWVTLVEAMQTLTALEDQENSNAEG